MKDYEAGIKKIAFYEQLLVKAGALPKKLSLKYGVPYLSLPASIQERADNMYMRISDLLEDLEEYYEV